MSKTYNAKDIRVLGEIEHIRLNPGMYIGDTSTPTHLIEEVLDNALDEALAGHAKIIAVVIDTKKKVYTVLDSGRGIPISGDAPIIVSTKLFSGAKFQDKKTAYQISAGLHGVGLVAINALSSYYRIEVYRNKKHALYEFNDTKLVNQVIEPFTSKDSPFSTRIEFTPDKKYFESIDPNLDRIRNRLTTASAEMPNDIRFVLKVDDETEVFALSLEKHFEMSCLTSSLDKLNIIQLGSEKAPEKFNMLLTYEQEGPVSAKIISSVNLLPASHGGSHITFLYDLLKDFFMAKAKKYGFVFQPNDCLYKLRAYLMLNLLEPKFSGQTKDVLTTVKAYYEKFAKDFKIQLEDFAKNNEETIQNWLRMFQSYRTSIDSKNMTKVVKNGRHASTKFTKLRDCTKPNGELYIVEGDSAGGSILQSRDPSIHAVLPLKGKSIPNVITKKDFLKNNEIAELITAFGTGLGDNFDLSKMRYSKIICATDADVDGNHIACLVTMAIATLVPDIVKAGMYFIAQTPLFAIHEGKLFQPIWNDAQLQKARETNRKIQRYKGLGEMNPGQLKISLLDEATRHLQVIEYSSNISELEKIFSNAKEKRKLLETE